MKCLFYYISLITFLGWLFGFGLTNNPLFHYLLIGSIAAFVLQIIIRRK